MVGRGYGVAVAASGFLGELGDEGGGMTDFAASLSYSLAVFEG